jgi:hypothetical protein
MRSPATNTKIRDGQLFVEGDDKPYIKLLDHTILMQITELKVNRQYTDKDQRWSTDKKTEVQRTKDTNVTEYLTGIVEFEDDDSLNVFGLNTTTVQVTFHLIPAWGDLAPDMRWYANIGYLGHNWETATEEKFYISARCPRECFDDLVAAVRRGHVENIKVGLESDMWTQDTMLRHMRSVHTKWYLPPDDMGPRAKANISLLRWAESFGGRPKAEGKPPVRVAQPVKLPWLTPSTIGWILFALFVAGIAMSSHH